MPRVICTLPNAATEINGHKFEPTEGGVVSGELSQEVVESFLEISGYALFEEDAAEAAEAAAKEAKAAAVKAEKLAAKAASNAPKAKTKATPAAPAPAPTAPDPVAAPAPAPEAPAADGATNEGPAPLDESVF